MTERVAILGGGVIGLCSAWCAHKRGFRVTVVDRNPPERDGCSFGNAGMIVPSHFVPLAAPGMVALGLKMMWNSESPFYVRPRLSSDLLGWGWKFWRAATASRVRAAAPVLRDLHLASRAGFEELADAFGPVFDFARNGLLMLCKTQHALDEEAKTAHEAKRLGVPAEVFDATQTAAVDPNVRMDVLGSVYYPKDCHLSPSRFMAALQSKLERGGAEFLWGREAIGWRTDGRRVVALQTRGGELAADEFVLAGGAWSPVVADGLGVNLPMQAGKGYSLTLKGPQPMPSVCAICTEARVTMTPMGETIRFGGTMEIAGRDERIDPVRVRGIVKSVPRYFPEFRAADFDGVTPWVGLRPCSPDGLPYLGRTGRYDNVVVATGHAMMGLSLGPVTGQLVGAILAGEKPEIDLALLSPDRYTRV